MPHWRATLAYDGTPYHGWQVQPGLATVQGTLVEAIAELTGETVLPQGSGRTDTGVHALGQVTSFTLAVNIPGDRLFFALNRVLPPSIRLLSLVEAPEEFHARHSAIRKTYEYRILPKRSKLDTVCSPFLAPYVWVSPRSLELGLLNEAAGNVVGTHDFTSFAAVDPDQEERHQAREGLPQILASNTRTIFASGWVLDEGHDPPLLRYRVTGSGFLHHMVRNLVGTFVEAGAGRIPTGSVAGIIAAKNRAAAGPTAPARGLFLYEVEY